MTSFQDYDLFDRYYTSLKLMGADRIFKSYLDLPSHQTLPLSIAHGVDFGYLSVNFEEFASEPLHLVHTEDQARSISKYKSVLRFPHPWLLLESDKRLAPIKNLVIGPPPSHRNYLRLYRHLKGEYGTENFTFLIKQRNHLDSHSKFLRDQGVNFISAGEIKSTSFYESLYTIISSSEVIYSSCPSSAVFFSAALGKKVVLIHCVDYDAIADYPIEKIVTRDPLKLRRCREIFAVISQNNSSSTKLARELLGEQYLQSKEDLRSSLFQAMEDCRELIYHNKIPIVKRAQSVTPTYFMMGAYYFKKINLSSLVSLISRSKLGLVDITFRNDFRCMGLGRAISNRKVTIRRVWLRKRSNLGTGFESSFLLRRIRSLRKSMRRFRCILGRH